MKKSIHLDHKAFVLVETLLVSLTIAGILLFLYVQYSRVTDSYQRLSRYNTVESLYRTNNIKTVLLKKANDSFYNMIDNQKIQEINDTTTIQGLGTLGVFFDDIELEKLYITTGNITFNELNNKLDSSFRLFLKSITIEEMSGEHIYRIFAKYKDGTFATISFNSGRGGE